MKYLLSLILTLSTALLAMNVKGQEPTLSLEDLIPGGKTYNKYAPKMPQKLAWYGDQLLYQKGDSLLIVSEKEEKEPAIFTTLSQINESLGTEEQLRNLYAVSLGTESKRLFVYATNHIYAYDIENKKMDAKFSRTAKMENNDISEQSLYLAYTRDNNLYIQNIAGEEKSITNEENSTVLCGQSVHKNEFGISKGTFWSPKGNLLAFYRMDQSMVTDYPIVDMSKRTAELKAISYPMAGMKSHHVTVGVHNTQTEETVFLKTGLPKEKFLTNIAWSPDESTIYIAELNRGQDTCAVNSYDALTGKKLNTLFTETHPKYVEPENPILFVKNNPSQFIWHSKRDGYNHLYLYNTKGELLKQITKGSFEVTSVLGFDQRGENLFYTSTEENPLERHVYKLNLKNNKKTKLTHSEGQHSAKLSASGNLIYDWYTSLHNAGEVAITNTKNNKSRIFYTAQNPFAKIDMPTITLGSVKTNDGKTDLHYRLVKPSDFDANKKYPVVVYVYGGPHSQMVSNGWMGQARGWDIYMAEKGYIVFTLDNRGTANRGFDFENITHRQLGVVETQDQMAGIDYLKSQPYVDAERIGVHGWSYGGFMTLNLLLRHPDVFKVGVAGGPVTDWKYYEIMYGERYMDSPQENPEGYKETSMLNHIGNLKGRLLLIHGDEDPVVVMQHSSQLIKSAIKEGVHPDFFVYPGHEHNMGGRDRVHLHEHITRYFDDFLKQVK